MEKKESSRFWVRCVSCLGMLLWTFAQFAPSGFAGEIYRYKRMWPILPQPWYFDYPSGVAIDRQGSVYVCESGLHRVQKFTADGQFLTKWGRRGSGDGELEYPQGIALDSQGNVYVADEDNQRVQVFSSEGRFLTKWSGDGSEDGRVEYPGGIAIDPQDNVYVLNQSSPYVLKFSVNGKLLGKWGKSGAGAEDFDSPVDIAVDRKGHVYVLDGSTERVRVLKFTAHGKFLQMWGVSSSWNTEAAIGTDDEGCVYVGFTDSEELTRVFKYSGDGVLLSASSRTSARITGVYEPSGLGVDGNGHIFLTGYDGVLKLTPKLQFNTSWRSLEDCQWALHAPYSIAVDHDGHVYVVGENGGKIRKYSSEGQPVEVLDGQNKWSVQAVSADGEGNVFACDTYDNSILKFNSNGRLIKRYSVKFASDSDWPNDIAADRNGNVYVIGRETKRVRRYSPDGRLTASWVCEGDRGWYSLAGIATDGEGCVYIADNDFGTIVKFSPNGKLLATWRSSLDSEGRFLGISGIAVDGEGNVYVTEGDYLGHRIQKLDANGRFICTWGAQGSDPGQLNSPGDIALGKNGNIYVADTRNNRVQMFQRAPQEVKSKAIIVAGGGPQGTNGILWDATQMCANFAYRALTYQGFMSQNIRYFSSNTLLDLDNNGVPDVAGKATNKNLEEAITDWAGDAESLVVYLTDHGGEGKFILSDSKETLYARDLASWLDAIPQVQTVLVLDACKSGSFLAPLASSKGRGRAVISSSGPSEAAFFGNQGTLSFSNFFWSQVFNGASLLDAYTVSEQATREALDQQHPMIESNGDDTPSTKADLAVLKSIGVVNGTSSHNRPPNVGEIEVVQHTRAPGRASFVVNEVTDRERDGIVRVWAVIRPPNFNTGDSGNPISQLPYAELERMQGTNRYEGSYSGFSAPGTYHVAVYAMDDKCNVSIPGTAKVVIDSPLRQRAILVAGNAGSEEMRRAVEYNMGLAYKALTAQGYDREDMAVLSTIPDLEEAPVKGTATLENLKDVIDKASQDSTRDLVIYLVGEGGKGSFEINGREKLSAEALSKWLDGFQSMASELRDVVLVYDGCRSASFLPMLSPPNGKKRVVIGSARVKQPACFSARGLISFSQFFWTRVLNGANVRDAFKEAKDAVMRASGSIRQEPQLDDNGNGRGNDSTDGQVARLLKIGVGMVTAGDAPVIGTTCGNKSIHGTSSADIWVRNIITTGTIERVWAVVTPPDFKHGSADHPVTGLPVFELKEVGSGRYEGTCKDLSSPGVYAVAVYALDAEGNLSAPQRIRITRAAHKE